MEQKLSSVIVTHSFSFDRKFLALSDNSTSIFIYSTKSEHSAPSISSYSLVTELKAHVSIISSISFHPSSHQFVSCSHDRNAYVWTLCPTPDEPESETAWSSTLVITKLTRAALFVSWSPKGDRFAIASGAKVISVCTYDPENDWWSSNLIKKHRSSITQIAWHPNGIILASACTDYRMRVFSTYYTHLDSEDLSSLTSIFGDINLKFGELIGFVDIEDKFWVDNVSFSLDGSYVLFTTFSRKICKFLLSEIKSSNNPSEKKSFQESNVLKENNLKNLTKVEFLNNDTILAVGYDEIPLVIEISNLEEWKLKLIKKVHPAKKIARKVYSAFESKVNALESGSGYGMTKKAYEDMFYCPENHSNTIVELDLDRKNGVFSSAGLDGRVVVWDLKEHQINI